MRVNVKVEGLNEISRKLQAVDDSMKARSVERVLMTGAQTFRNDWRRRAPVGENRSFARSIIAKLGKRRGNYVASAFAAVNRKVSWYAHFVIGGTKAHTIQAKAGKALLLKVRSLWAGGSSFRGKVQHPGAKADPFTDEGVAANEEQVLNQVQNDLGALFDTASR